MHFFIRLIISTLFLFSLHIASNAQNWPFPQNMSGAHYSKPAVNATNMAYYISEFYKAWKTAYLKPAGSTAGGYYVYTQGTSGPSTVTVSEAQGYGMIVFALMAGTGTYADPDAKKYFDGMYAFFRAHPSRYTNDLMSWEVQTNNAGGETFVKECTATDGDLDIAYALILAHYQWGSAGAINYLAEAKKMIAAIKKYEINPDNKRVMILDYTDWSSHPDNMESRTSDWMAGHFRTFYEVTGDVFWTSVASTIYTLYNQVSASYSSTTGLVPDFINNNPPQPFSFAGKTHYSFDACRFPWRIATDFVHNSNASAKSALNKITGWLITKTGGDPNAIMAEYQLNGTAVGTYNSTAFTSPFLCACMADKSATSQDYLNKGWNIIKSEKEAYYEDSINLLCMLLMSGNWWRPEQTGITTNSNKTEKMHFSTASHALNNTLSLNYTIPHTGNVQLSVYTVNGKTIYSTVITHKEGGTYRTAVSLGSSISKGVYLGVVGFLGKEYSETIRIY